MGSLGVGLNVASVRGILAENPPKHKIQGNWGVGQFPITSHGETGNLGTGTHLDGLRVNRDLVAGNQNSLQGIHSKQ
jgi:hypothetical protein